MANLKHREMLLAGLSYELHELMKKERDPRLGTIQVTFLDNVTGEALHVTDLDGALNAISSDLYYDENNDWSNASRVKIETI